ncbi:hypothetical protein Dsin_029347 [Dipteronia sinensis]|uniref:Uncharacterized protein n=1 Tax=Dipteronia sinensis TaxID=43782 RepID=A0AAD9ZTW9_9ROSI|nr:hypothetical protein Dsin_029347 [Dipteronia sinensis]
MENTLKFRLVIFGFQVKVVAIIRKNDKAIMNFEKIVICMDEYAMLLKMKCDNGISLNQLVHDLLSIDPTRPEVFVVWSVLWERKDERGVLSYAEKGVDPDAPEEDEENDSEDVDEDQEEAKGKKMQLN